jgi:hypothetical protein
MTYMIFRKKLIYSGQEPRGIFFGRWMRDFAQNSGVIEKSHTTARIAGVEGKEKHRESVL